MINSLECRVHSCSEVDLQSIRSVIFVNDKDKPPSPDT